jgi:Tfp pilus assembly protein PilN
MQRINLIPKSRQRDRQRKVRVRLWVGMSLCYAVLLAAACVSYRGMSASHDLAALTAELDEKQAELTRLDDQQNSLRPRLNEQKLILAAEQSISDQPDWSLLLTYLADEVLGDKVVLGGCVLAPSAPGDQADNTDSDTLVLTLTGYGQSTADVSQFILRLEQVGLFEKVTLARTNREPYLAGQAIAFEARCVMVNGGGSHE